MTVPEGLAYSCHPCARVLSVAGLLTILALFPGWRTVYSEGEMAPFPPGIPTRVDDRDNTVIEAACSV